MIEKPVFIGFPMSIQDMLIHSGDSWSFSAPEQTSSAFLPGQIMAEWYVKSNAIMESKGRLTNEIFCS